MDSFCQLSLFQEKGRLVVIIQGIFEMQVIGSFHVASQNNFSACLKIFFETSHEFFIPYTPPDIPLY